MAAELPTIYQQFIHVGHYARFRDDLGRRETWEETVDRYLDFFKARSKNKKIPWDDLRTAILGLEIMPSMRAMMTAGNALQKDQISNYNCSFIPIDNSKCFDEIMYILSCGVGVGFSVESRYTNKLPEIPDELHDTDTTIDFKDSKLGWASGFREFISLLYAGKIAKWDVSKIRPAGARLKTFGGRASGPEPLVDLLKFTTITFSKARGRRLSPLECHDIVCKVADVIVSGGVRRSALISLTDLNDDKMREAKSGNWWLDNGQRALANISAVYENKPDMETFMSEWLALLKSHSGERGIFSRKASQLIAGKFGRRDPEISYGTNPSLRSGTRVLTDMGILPIEKLENCTFKTRNIDGTFSESVCRLSGINKQLIEVKFYGGQSYYCTSEHQWPVVDKNSYIKKTTMELMRNDLICAAQNIDILTNGNMGNYDDGFIIGWNLGDGWITDREKGIQIGFITSEEDADIRSKIEKYLIDNCNYNGKYKLKSEINVNNQKLRDIFSKFGVTHKSNGLPSKVWDECSESFRRGMIDGLFSSDGFADATLNKKGFYNGGIGITSCHEKMARDISDMLGFYGIKNTIKKRNIVNAKFPNGKTYNRNYTVYGVYINKSFAARFRELFTLTHKRKQKNIDILINSVKLISCKNLKVKSVEALNIFENVWDIGVKNDNHCFQLAHSMTGNCSEIILRPYQFCNLTEVVVRSTDTVENLKRKVRLATILGTLQSTVTDFRYINKKWKKNTEEERLLGVSMTGIMDNELLNQTKTDFVDPNMLSDLRAVALSTNQEFAKILNIEESAAITCVKPSGTVSQLVDSASGIHPRFAKHYIRRVRLSKTDPLAEFMVSKGYKAEEDFYNKSNWVFAFPMEAPSGSRLVKDMTAIQQLEHWLIFQDQWCEHKPSITVYIGDDEWLEVGAWVYKHIDRISGVAFLPRDNGSYRQAPYEAITEEQYLALTANQLKKIDWTEFREETDNTENTKTLACTGNVCEL